MLRQGQGRHVCCAMLCNVEPSVNLHNSGSKHGKDKMWKQYILGQMLVTTLFLFFRLMRSTVSSHFEVCEVPDT